MRRYREMERQLTECSESYSRLQNENRALRSGLEQLLCQLQMLQWRTPQPMCAPNVPWVHSWASTMLPQVIEEGAEDLEGQSSAASAASASEPSSPRAAASALSSVAAAGGGAGQDPGILGILASGAEPGAWASSPPGSAKAPVVEEGVEETMPLNKRIESATKDLAAMEPFTPPRHFRRGTAAKNASTPGPWDNAAEEDAEAATVAEDSEASVTPAAAGPREGKFFATPSTAASAASPGSAVSPFRFSFNLRRVEGQPLGLEVSLNYEEGHLRVEGIQEGTVADAWNRQCQGEARVIQKGDMVVSVNGYSAPELMFIEFTDFKRLLFRLEVKRAAGTRLVLPNPQDEV